MAEYEHLIRGLNIRPAIGFFGYSSVTLVRDEDENILCDTGGYGVRQFIYDLKGRVRIDKIFLTHLHFDHCANITLFKDTPVYIHKAELDALKADRSVFSDIYEFIDHSLKQLNVVPFTFEEQLSKNTKILLTPGHTVGHSSLEIHTKSGKVVVAGDAIETYQEYLNPITHNDCYDDNKYINSYNLIKDNYSTIIPGHSSIINDGKLVNSSFELKTF